MAGDDARPVPIDDALLALMHAGVSIIVASRDAELRPHLMRALACRVSADRRRVTLLMARRGSRALLDALAACGAIAVVFSQPSTHRTAQLKGRDATIGAAEPGDVALADAHAERFAAEIGRLGFAAPLAYAVLDRGDDEMVAVTFTPTAGYEQTPGPGAGRALGVATQRR